MQRRDIDESTFVVFRLDSNSMGDMGATAIGEALKQNSSIFELSYVVLCARFCRVSASFFLARILFGPLSHVVDLVT